MELLFGQLLAAALHAAGLHDDRIAQLRGVPFGQVPQRIAHAQQDFRFRIGCHVRQQAFVVVEVEPARTAPSDQAVDHVDQRRPFALQVVGQQAIEAPPRRIAVETFERGGERCLVERRRGHHVMRRDALSRVARREDDLRFRVAAVDVAPLEEFDRQHRDFVDAPHGRRIDADLGEVFAVDTAPLGLEVEQFERRAVECRGGIDRQYLFEGSHSGQRYIFIPDSVSHFGCGSAFLPFRPEAADAPDTSRYRTENPKQRLTERVCRSVSRCRSRVGRPVCARVPRYFLVFLGARIMFIFLPSSLGIISTLASSSRSVAKRSSRISPCSLKTIERPRKKT